MKEIVSIRLNSILGVKFSPINLIIGFSFRDDFNVSFLDLLFGLEVIETSA